MYQALRSEKVLRDAEVKIHEIARLTAEKRRG